MRRVVSWAAFALFVLSFVRGGYAEAIHQGSKPHILFVLQDDLGRYDVAFHGNKDAEMVTANITRLAREGIILESHYVHWHCSPTRRSFLSGRLPVHHTEQLSATDGDDVDLRYSLVSDKLTSAGYACHWYGKGHTGYKSMAHLPTRRGFKHFTGFLTGSQSYTSNDRWQDEHPLNTDAQFQNPPPTCYPGADAADLAHVNSIPELPGCTAVSVFTDQIFACAVSSTSTVASASACCNACDAATNATCSHWSFVPSTSNAAAAAAAAAGGQCTLHPGECKRTDQRGVTSGVRFHPTPGPHPHPAPPSPPAPGDSGCHADTYSSTLYGEIALQALKAHDASTPLFIYLPFQAVHGPYNTVPYSSHVTNITYEAMLWDADVYVGALIAHLKAKAMYQNTLVVYSSDNGGTGAGVNYPLRGEKHTNWNGGMNVAAFVSGGIIPTALQGTTSSINCHIVDWYPTLSFLAGVDGTDNPPVAPLPIKPGDPSFDIYGNNSYPPVDGVNIWPFLMGSSTNRSIAHPTLVLSKEVIIMGPFKLLVAQNNGWDHSADNGWKTPTSKGFIKPNISYPCDATDPPGDLGTLPGIPGQLPCLFNLEADASERHDLGSEPTNAALLFEMWEALNNTVLTAFCKHGAGCNRSPGKLLGPCNSSCASAYWKSLGGTGEGPECGVPGCTGEVPAAAAGLI